MYYRDKDGNLWLKEDDGFRNVGVHVRERHVTFNKIEPNVVIGSVKVPALENPIPVTIREAIKQLGITEANPLHILKDKEV